MKRVDRQGDNVRLSHLDVETLEKIRVANRLSLQGIHDLYLHGNRFLAGCDGLVPALSSLKKNQRSRSNRVIGSWQTGD
jgi:hypothetical protein